MRGFRLSTTSCGGLACSATKILNRMKESRAFDLPLSFLNRLCCDRRWEFSATFPWLYTPVFWENEGSPLETPFNESTNKNDE